MNETCQTDPMLLHQGSGASCGGLWKQPGAAPDFPFPPPAPATTSTTPPPSFPPWTMLTCPGGSGWDRRPRAPQPPAVSQPLGMVGGFTMDTDHNLK